EIEDINPEALLCDGFDEAIIGMAERINLGPVVAYDVDKMIDIMIKRDGMTYEEAIEYFDYNILGAWMGENTPVYIQTNRL
ncbi:MAG: hypothetical protein ABFD07_00655, partial [Methanobacterium sp.]